ncbi:unnamed protein product, partial [Sphacelaria rigidula]
MSRNGLGSTGVVLKLEATHGYGRDCLLALHTLVLSYNQVQVLDYSVLATMPALRHLDVSHNLLCRMEPMDGHELPSRLETLNMSHNRISRIGGISQCGALRVLDLSHNQIKSTLGLGHLLLLEQLDLSHNLISKAVSARALSFNRSLKLLRLEGNPFAADPRYRATLTCLLPHLRAIDRKGMPPSSSLERRGFGGDSGESTAWAGGGARGKVVSREFQEEQDERRSNEWRQMMASREEIAQRQIEADERKTRERYQIANPVKQRQLAEELARPHRRAHASKDTTSRTKDITCSRPTIAFGVTYRQPSTDTSPTSFPSRRRQNSQQMRSSNLMGHPQPQDPSACSEDGGTRDGTYKAGNAENGSPRSHQDLRAYSSTAVVMSSTDCHDEVGRFNVSHADFPNNDPLHTTHGGVEDSTSPKTTKPNHFTSNGILQPQQQYCHQQTVGVHDGGAESLVSTSGDQNGVTRGMHVDDTEDVNCTRDLPDERGRATEGDTDDSVLDPSQRSVLEEWLKDVEQETETAATALKVLLKMHQQRGIKRCGSRRLAGFRAALDGMGLFTEQFGASPDFVGEEGVHADRVLTAARRVAMTKAAVKNMLRLMEAEPAGSPELDQYAHFVVQQDEIVL